MTTEPVGGSTAPDPPDATPNEHFEDLRIAVVMNGGVSLAVWIGGVTHEINRLVRGDSCYGPLLELTESTASVDVVSGTSAGGLNGAFLAMALAHDQDLISLRDLWLSKGSISALLRQPYETEQPSLLDGDDYFLPELRDALGALWSPTPTDPGEVPLELRMTTTLLSGTESRFADDFGALVSDVRHRALFKFSRGADSDEDVFADEAIVDRLALAARSTASFPVAFEASFCPVKEKTSEPSRPDMDSFVDFDSSHYVIDGGVLQNKPLKPALAAILDQRADRDVRRVLAYVVPDPGSTAAAKPDEPGEAPGVAEVTLASLGGLPRVESISQDLNDLRSHNELARERLRSRVSITSYCSPEECGLLARSLFAAYRQQRIEPAINYIVVQIEAGLAEITQRGFGRRGRRQWLHRILCRQELPWVPEHAPGTDAAAEERSPDGWRWGLRPVEHSSHVLLDILGRIQHLRAVGGVRASLKSQWDEAFDLYRVAGRRRKKSSKFWQSQAAKIREHLGSGAGDVPPDATARVEEWAQAALGELREAEAKAVEEASKQGEPLEDAGRLMQRLAGCLTGLHPAATDVLAALDDTKDPRLAEEARELRKLVEFFVGGKTALTREEAIDRLLMFEVIQQALGGTGSGVDQIIELIQVSADCRSPFGGPDSAERKLAGIQLGHFGAFYKRSWRANDWMYGRLDAASRLVQVVLNPERLATVTRYRGEESTSERVADQLEEIAFRSVEDVGARALLEAKWNRQAALAELEYLKRPEDLIPEYLPVCTEAVVRRLHLEILQSELVTVARSVAHDLERGGHRQAVGTGFQSEFGDAETTTTVPADQVERLFRACSVRAETIADEVGSDRLTAVAGQVLAVAVSAGQAKRSGLGVLRGLLRALRGPTLLFHLMARNVLLRSRSGAAANAAAVTAGATLVAVHYLVPGAVLPRLVLSLAWLTLGAGLLLFLFARPGLVAAATVVVGSGFGYFYVTQGLQPPEWSLETWRAIATGLASLVLLYLLGSFSWPRLRHRSHRKNVAKREREEAVR